MIRYRCSNCGDALAVDDTKAGRPFVCGLCGQTTTVPAQISHETPIGKPVAGSGQPKNSAQAAPAAPAEAKERTSIPERVLYIIVCIAVSPLLLLILPVIFLMVCIVCTDSGRRSVDSVSTAKMFDEMAPDIVRKINRSLGMPVAIIDSVSLTAHEMVGGPTTNYIRFRFGNGTPMAAPVGGASTPDEYASAASHET